MPERRIKTIQNVSFFLLLILTTYVFFGLVKGFLMPVFWAIVLAIIFNPVFRWWQEIWKNRRSLAAGCTILTIIFIVIVPLYFIGVALVNEVNNLYEKISSGEIDLQGQIDRLEGSLPLVAEYTRKVGVDLRNIQQGFANAIGTITQFMASKALALGQNAVEFSALFFLMLYVLFFFVRDGRQLMDVFIRALPLGDQRERRLFAKFAEVSRATLKGTLVVAAAQGSIGGLFFWILGIDAPIFWGVLMTILSLLPAVGSALVWLPAAIILFITGHPIKGFILVLAGTLIIGLIDNLLRPILVGRDTKMPDYLVLLSTLGGISVLGISGFVIGPIIASLFLVVWDMFIEEYGMHDSPEKTRRAAEHPETAPPPPAITEEGG